MKIAFENAYPGAHAKLNKDPTTHPVADGRFAPEIGCSNGAALSPNCFVSGSA